MAMQWFEAVEIIQPYVFKISTPRGSGTGFIISNGKVHNICGVATANHVIEHAHYWEEPIRLEHMQSGKSIVARKDQRAIFPDYGLDTAAIIFEREDLKLPSDMLPLTPKDKFLKVGNNIGWLGFPAIPGASLCFFGGKISAWIQEQQAYLVDGVAINGVSGGPAFCILDDVVTFIGVVSAYVPNRATGEVLPGLAVVRGVKQFHDLAPTFASIDQAKSQEAMPLAPPPEVEQKGVMSKRAT
jgi:hypothetical protein